MGHDRIPEGLWRFRYIAGLGCSDKVSKELEGPIRAIEVGLHFLELLNEIDFLLLEILDVHKVVLFLGRGSDSRPGGAAIRIDIHARGC